MPQPTLTDRFADTALLLVWHVVRVVGDILLNPASTLSIGSLACALVIAAAWLSRRHVANGLAIPLRPLCRLLFPRGWLASRSSRLDFELLLLNTFVFGVLLGGALLSARFVSTEVQGLLVAVLGAPGPSRLSDGVATVLLTVAIFLAYELAYWVQHYLSHTVPFLWEMHKVHHSAEVLTPLTNSRVHPIESIMLLNMIALFIGVTEGVVLYALGHSASQLTLAGVNAMVVVGTYLVAHLHHTHVWIAFTGRLGAVFVSPAHHQVHHSTNPIHFNKNLGSVLAIWDWLFGTLHVPARTRERLSFGLGDQDATEHTVAQELFRPVRAIGAGLLLGDTAMRGTGRDTTTAREIAGKS